LDTWLDGVQASISGTLTVICDTDASAAMLSQLDAPLGEKRILIASAGTGEKAAFANGGVVSFGRFFWANTALGGTVGQSFLKAKQSMVFASGQHAELDDDGDGVFNSKKDGTSAIKYSIGTGIQLSGDEPLIGAISDPQDIGTA